MVMVTPGRVSDHPLLEALLEAVRTPLRLFFSAITMADIKQQIDDHMKAKAKRSKDLPEFSEVLESGKAAWDAGQSFPPALMAKLIKFMLLRIKNTFKVTPEKGIKAGKASTSSKGPGKASAQGKKMHQVMDQSTMSFCWGSIRQSSFPCSASSGCRSPQSSASLPAAELLFPQVKHE
uniref:Uncharacterized protein n=1 Tax=Eptatretus burgeri TaxID=7764 RepID=A0A8C4R158_EPTBU